jgi:hypothetical protein
MKLHYLASLLFLASLGIAGCSESAADKPVAQAKSATPPVKQPPKEPKPEAKPAEESDEKEIQENLAKLSPEDRKLAEEQRFCVVNNDERLGEMGKPFKVMIKDQPVFLCCPSCEKKALKDPDKTLAKVKELKEKTASSKK